ncbi:MAG: OsmC family protein [Anaerolineaceae bacterium]|nr:OsmC family protein [Anaerolineaceae bacterium]
MATITTQYLGNSLFKTLIGDHALLIDVPPSMGGKDRGVDPMQFFAASVGSCVAAMIANYCDNCGVDPIGLSVDVDYDLVENPVYLTHFKVRVHISDEDLCHREEAMRRIIEHCPVNLSILNWEGIDVEIDHTPE